jgi:hypothetical protein
LLKLKITIIQIISSLIAILFGVPERGAALGSKALARSADCCFQSKHKRKKSRIVT